MNKLENKVAVVTGGSSGIGLATAKELIIQGAKVIVTGRNQAALESTAKEIGATAIVSDQSNLLDIDALVDKTKHQFGKIDILVLNAGIYSIVPFEMVTESNYDFIMGINLKGVFFTLQKFVPILNEGASVVLISALGGYTNVVPGTSVYNSTRAAVNSLVRSISIELAPKGIRVNAVCPGPIETPIFGKMGLPDEVLGQFAGAIVNKVPLKRFGSPLDVAKLVSFISSDDGSFITGSDYLIDGGIRSVPIMS